MVLLEKDFILPIEFPVANLNENVHGSHIYVISFEFINKVSFVMYILNV